MAGFLTRQALLYSTVVQRHLDYVAGQRTDLIIRDDLTPLRIDFESDFNEFIKSTDDLHCIPQAKGDDFAFSERFYMLMFGLLGILSSFAVDKHSR